MAMYHSWDSQNAWLRQIHAHNYLFVNPRTARASGIADDDWIWVESQWGKVRCMARYSEAVEPGTVWTWNAIGKAPGAWNLAPEANESRLGFLLNHVINEELPTPGGTISNSDPVTGGRVVRRARAHLPLPRPRPPRRGRASSAGGARTGNACCRVSRTLPEATAVTQLALVID
jgi:anaerobic selenocysteine-containing dehydrogenase